MKLAVFTYWQSVNSLITNVNVFSSVLSLERMVTLTSSSDCQVDSNDENVYLADRFGRGAGLGGLAA